MSDIAKITELGPESKISDVFALLKDSGGDMLKIVLRRKNGRPLAAAIFVHGEEASAEIVAACDQIEAGWDEQEGGIVS